MAHTFLQSEQTSLVFLQWIEQYLMELHACSEGSYRAFVQQFFTQLTVQVQNNVGANHVDLKLNSGEHDDVAVVQKAVGCEVIERKGDCTGRAKAVTAEDVPRTYKEALVQTALSPPYVSTKPAHFDCPKVSPLHVLTKPAHSDCKWHSSPACIRTTEFNIALQ